MPTQDNPKIQKKEEDFFSDNGANKDNQVKIEISDKVMEVKEEVKPEKTKKKKKNMAKKINLDDFENMVFDDGVPQAEKDKIIKQNQIETT